MLKSNHKKLNNRSQTFLIVKIRQKSPRLRVHYYSNGPIMAFMKNRNDFFILFQFYQKIIFILEFVAFCPIYKFKLSS